MSKETTKVVLVDDDDIIRESLTRNFDWAACDCELIGSAEDGISGLELIEELEPDIVLSDILMPSMDGLTMLKEMKNRGFHPRVILLSGHEEFEYARTAISLAVEAYLNKPLDQADLSRALNRAKQSLENERRFAARVKETMPLLRQAFFSRLFSGVYREVEAIREQADFLELPLGEGPFLCLAFKLDPACPEMRKRDVLGREFLKTAVASLAEESLDGLGPHFSYDPGESGFVFLLSIDQESWREGSEVLSQRVEELIHLTRARYKVPLTLGLGGLHAGLSGIAPAYREALKALSCDHLFGTGRIISINDLNLSRGENPWETQSLALELATAVRVADPKLVTEQLSRFRGQILAQNEVPMIRIRMDASAVAFALINEADSWLKQGRPAAHAAFDAAYEKIQRLGTIEEILSVLKSLALSIIQLVEDTRLSHHQTIVHKATAYIEGNFQNEDLSLGKVAQAVGISQSHLSFLLKKKINTSFHKYLTKTRIERAMALLRENDFKAYEIADMVGYSNAQYFSSAFKKYTGCSPLQFRSEAVEESAGTQGLSRI